MKYLILLLILSSDIVACTHLRFQAYSKEKQTVTIYVRKPAYELEAELSANDYCNSHVSLLETNGHYYTYTCTNHH